MNDTEINDPAAFELVFVDDDETAEQIGVTIEQTGGVALTTFGQWTAWAPSVTVDDAIEWARAYVAEQTGVEADNVSALRDSDWNHNVRRVGFREVAP